MKVGDVVTVYFIADERKEVCDHGVTHKVPIYEVKKLTITEVRRELVPFLNYTSDGEGDVLYATDRQGRTYRKQPHWDGPRATQWVREKGCRNYDQYPRRVFSRDITGRVLFQ